MSHETTGSAIGTDELHEAIDEHALAKVDSREGCNKVFRVYSGRGPATYLQGLHLDVPIDMSLLLLG